MSIREATADDLGEIAALIHELAAYERAADEVAFDLDELGHHLFGPAPAAWVLVAETDPGRVAGLALYFPTFSTWLGRPGIWLEDLFVRPEFRGGGHGRALFDAVRDLNRRIDGRAMSTADAERSVAFLNDLDRVLAIAPDEEADRLEPDLEAMLQARADARAARNWAESDRLRDELLARGVLVEDSRDGQRWRRQPEAARA